MSVREALMPVSLRSTPRSPMAYRCRKAMLPDDIAEFRH